MTNPYEIIGLIPRPCGTPYCFLCQHTFWVLDEKAKVRFGGVQNVIWLYKLTPYLLPRLAKSGSACTVGTVQGTSQRAVIALTNHFLSELTVFKRKAKGRKNILCTTLLLLDSLRYSFSCFLVAIYMWILTERPQEPYII